ncbi:MAG TPA: cupredoxin domain-containing protein [Nitriliruptorales bacterium]
MRKTGAILAAAALVLTGCGSANQDAIQASGLACPEGSDCYDEVKPPGPGDELEIEAGDLFFVYEGVRSDQDDLTIRVVEGELEVTLVDNGAAVHNFRIDGAVADSVAGKKVEAAGGSTETGVLPLFAGSYQFYCDIPGHRAAGMEGTIDVLTEDQVAEA